MVLFPAGVAGRAQPTQAFRRHPVRVRAQVFSPEPDFVQGELLSAGIPSVQLQRLPRLPVQDGAVRPAENFGGRHTQAVSPRGKLL